MLALTPEDTGESSFNFYPRDLRVAIYGPLYHRTWRNDLLDIEVIQDIIDDTADNDVKNIDLLHLLPPIKATEELDRLVEINADVNHLFHYRSNAVNFWYSQPPQVSLILGWGDCKAYAAYKYHLLKQLGYKNVKVITVTIPDGRGYLGGHALVLLNDLWVLDINWPYFYTFERLRENSGLDKAFDERGVYDLE
jgi:predicted transglutaminase-like cysteine proteinase